jgi:hypothetical protein
MKCCFKSPKDATNIIFNQVVSISSGDRRAGHDRIVVGFTATCASSGYRTDVIVHML